MHYNDMVALCYDLAKYLGVKHLTLQHSADHWEELHAPVHAIGTTVSLQDTYGHLPVSRSLFTISEHLHSASQRAGITL
jgi:hypothetical protein